MLARLAADGQRPTQLFLTCADSRIVPNLITTTGPGDQFCVRNVGNLVPRRGSDSDSVGAAVEYAVEILGVTSIVVCGHSHCGAATAVLDRTTLDRTGEGRTPVAGSGLRSWLDHFEPSVRRADGMPDLTEPVTGAVLSPADKLSVANVAVQVQNLRSFDCVRRAERDGGLELLGLWFDLGTASTRVVRPEPPYLTPLPLSSPAAGPPGLIR